jgi:anti-anti-sigma factor
VELLFQQASDRGTFGSPNQKFSFAMILITEVFEFEPDITGISCSGRFTLGTRLSETEALIQTMIDRGVRKLVLDLTHVDFVDSAGLGIIMRVFGEMSHRGGQFRISGPHEQVKRLFDITHTSAILAVDADLVTSIQKLQEGQAAGTA